MCNTDTFTYTAASISSAKPNYSFSKKPPRSSEMDENTTQQEEELLVLESIFQSEFSKKNGLTPEIPYTITIELHDDHSEDKKKILRLYFGFPDDYPSAAPPRFTVTASWLSDTKSLTEINSALTQLYKEQNGESCIFSWVEWLRENCLKLVHKQNEEAEEQEEVAESDSDADDDPANFIQIFHGESLTDRKSKFQAHAAEVTSAAEAAAVLAQLKRNKRIRQATHNIVAYIIDEPRDLSCDDDGEHGAGEKLLNLLRLSNYTNTIVVVTRWYGGIHLGQDRFKHITNTARDVIISMRAAQVESSNDPKPGQETIKLRTSEDVYNRLKWDKRYDETEYIIGYMDRFLGMQELDFEEFEPGTGDIPWHRVWYIRKGDLRVWDRETRTDMIFRSGETSTNS